ncbi:hypothetical protein GIY23_05330 [Allosaccharopolyspora coralli]|uniref:Peptidase S58 family protein n=1 Tax=Allosaccharopolyspora coralli TaxID=2665642 RepID=A0A5Q3Q6H3_9PSEU|nr:P1 family peptidase [Allosaccharopolyspora coralli]QGK69036.1 hypothetical protein GIY23_05330 [Allosaccharopolyspora coralli]
MPVPRSESGIVDVPGVAVGHHQRIDAHWATGTSVVLVPDGAMAAVDVRGGGPGTRETDALDPTHLVQRAHAVVLTGGSAYGLAAADGVMGWLGDRGHGLPVGADAAHVVPIVPAAVLFDVPMNDWGNRPDAEFGRLACEAAGDDRRQGNVGAGAGAVSGHVKGGIGTASVTLPDGATVGVLVAVNSSGSPVDPDSGTPWGATVEVLRRPPKDEVEAGRPDGTRPGRHGPVGRPLNTTIGVVASDRPLSKAECHRVAVAAHDGLARAVRPAHGMTDGDTFFALSTAADDAGSAAEAGRVTALDEVCATAATLVERAIVRAVFAAEPIGDVSSYSTRYPSARE